MKKIFSIVAILLCFATSYGQDTKPTKQETMDWIGGKIIKYKSSKIYSIKYENNVITYENSSFRSRTIIKVYLEKITSYDFNVSYPEGTNGYGKIGKIIKGNGLVKWLEPSGSEFLTLEDFSLNGDGFDLSLELGLLERLKNALDTLIQYNTKEPGEKF